MDNSNKTVLGLGTNISDTSEIYSIISKVRAINLVVGGGGGGGDICLKHLLSHLGLELCI